MNDEMKQLLEAYPQYREKLYIRGFLLTDGGVDAASYPFYGTWREKKAAGYTLLVHPKQRAWVSTQDQLTMILIGHAYDPVGMCSDEKTLLQELASLRGQSDTAFWRKFHDLTGSFVLIWMQDGLHIAGDPSGMLTAFYGQNRGKVYVSSHTMLAAELMGPEPDPYAEKLISYRFFPLLGNSLPGDLTRFTGLRRLVPNHECIFRGGKFENRRFFYPQVLADRSYESIIEEAAAILQRSLQLIPEKWDAPAISLTGGCDSKTTLACAAGSYDRYRYYSYRSSDSEQVDAEAAQTICEALGLEHRTYEIPQELPPEDRAEVVAKLLRWNTGDIIDCNPNDVRKRIVLDKITDFDVEVKSWASEIGRAYYSKRFAGRMKFPPEPTGRACTTLYKFFLHNRALVRQTDRVFEQYLSEFYAPAPENPVAWQEQFFWEFRVPSWNGLVITGEHYYSSDITIPYNNRRLLTLLLSVPLDKRIGDTLYTDIRRRMNPAIDATGIAVTNLKHTQTRAKLENLYWIVHSRFPL